MKRILVVPMSAMAETSGPVSRCCKLAKGYKEAGAQVATCMAEDVNFRPLTGITNYFLDIPMPLGLPKPIATKSFPVAQKLGITSHKAVPSFDEVLHLTGNLDYKYIVKSVSDIRRAIVEFKADVVYSEFNISAIIASKLENVKLFATVSYPTQHSYAHSAKLAHGLNRFLQEVGLPQVESALMLFDWADERYCFSIKELEPFGEGVKFCGALKKVHMDVHERERNKILVYMGNGTITAKKMKDEISEAFRGSPYDVYIASSYLKEETDGNIWIAHRWEFDELLDDACLFINHGGQNSIVDGLQHGVPQIVVPGKVFERRFNAESLVKNNAGIMLEQDEFCAEVIREKAKKVIVSDKMRESARELGCKLNSLQAPYIHLNL